MEVNAANFVENILDSLTDTHLWELAQRITSEQELRDLGLKVLHLPGDKVDLVLHNKKDIELAAHEALKTWRKRWETPQEAYQNLYKGLWNLEWRWLAVELKNWVEDLTSPEPPAADSTTGITTTADSPPAASATTIAATADSTPVILPTVNPGTVASPPTDSPTTVLLTADLSIASSAPGQESESKLN